MKAQLSIEENFKISKNKISDYLESVETQDKSEFVYVFTKLMRDVYREIDKLLSLPPDLTIVSIGTRNIIELYLISRHIFTDEKWLSNWLGQSHKDAVDIQDGFLTLMRKYNKDTSELEAIRDFTNEFLEQSKYESKSGFNMRELAGIYGHSEDYISTHKLCSKLVHPTSMKINAYDALTANSNYADILRYVASYFAMQTEELIDEVKASKFA